MKEETILQHIALEYQDKTKAETFFTKILEIPLIKTFTLSEKLSEEIFGIKEQVEIQVYDNGNTCFEIFITKKPGNKRYNHVCIKVKDKEKFIQRCKKYNIQPIFVKKDEKTLYFIRDFSYNLFEIK